MSLVCGRGVHYGCSSTAYRSTSAKKLHKRARAASNLGLAWLQVLLGRWQLSLVAVKVLKEECTQQVSSSELVNLRREATMLQALNHPAILRFYGACFTCKPVRSVRTRCRHYH